MRIKSDCTTERTEHTEKKADDLTLLLRALCVLGGENSYAYHKGSNHEFTRMEDTNKKAFLAIGSGVSKWQFRNTAFSWKGVQITTSNPARCLT